MFPINFSLGGGRFLNIFTFTEGVYSRGRLQVLLS